MLRVQYQNYIPNSLRKNRSEALQEDLSTFYNTYMSETKLLLPEEITVSIFGQIWERNGMHFIFRCLAEEESQEEFAHLCYEIVWKKYFYLRDKPDKVFALFCLYFFFYACESRNRILISPIYAQLLRNFVVENRNDKNSHYMKVAFQLHQRCFTYATKIGLRNPIVKLNGDPPRSPVIVRSEPLEHVSKIQCELKETHRRQPFGQEDKQTLRDKLLKYQKLKKQFQELNTKPTQTTSTSTVPLTSTTPTATSASTAAPSAPNARFHLDIYFCSRVERLIKNYKQFVYGVTEKKKEEENQ